MEKVYRHKTVRGHAILSVMLSSLLFNVIGWSCSCTCVFGSTDFVKSTDRTLVCDPGRVLLTSALCTSLACARKCKEQPECTGFMLQLQSKSSHGASSGARLGTCFWCPANTIVNISYTITDAQLETWIHVLGHLLHPGDKCLMKTPGTLSVGRIVTLRGTVPDPVPDHSQFTLYINDDRNIAVAIDLRFLYLGIYNSVHIHTRTNGMWYTETRLPEEFFPFLPGGKIDFAVLATSERFQVYINGDFIFIVTSTAKWVGHVGHVAVKKINDALITF
ncbi:galectin [Plakobranchus ocellatus]|uniref:Galectin n=1 Tax=Plakobranchus ocellatus TaxID=259542 RepID=A0AAV4CFM3_9GAST|nr:galectin [Plakobranchus ocellatus]